MEKFDLYKDIQSRTGGEIYAGIVGPVRTGKSAFARKFVEHLVLPELSEQERAITKDTMPSSASGRTVTTVEPKFIPRSAVEIAAGDGTVMRVRDHDGRKLWRTAAQQFSGGGKRDDHRTSENWKTVSCDCKFCRTVRRGCA